MTKRYLTYHYRIKDSSSTLKKYLLRKSLVVNYVWNESNNLQKEALENTDNPWLSAFTLNKAMAGVGKRLDLHSQSVQAVCEEYASKRKQFKKPFLKYRTYKNLPWIPFKVSALRINRETGKCKFNGLEFNLWYSRALEGNIKTGSIVRDSRGRWYINITCELPPVEQIETPSSSVGIDLGLKDIMTLSDGRTFAAQRYYRRQQENLAKAQREGNSKKVRKIHAKIKNQRRDFNHKLSREIVNNYDTIFIGNVSASSVLKNTKSKTPASLTKSIYDAGWHQSKTFIAYKALASGKIFREVPEAFSTQTCSCCGEISRTSPKGFKDLNIRIWKCSNCRTLHSRDINAAKNILRSGHRSLLEEGIRIFSKSFAGTSS